MAPDDQREQRGDEAAEHEDEQDEGDGHRDRLGPRQVPLDLAR